MKNVVASVCFLAFLAIFSGCGPTETSVIQPEEDYELTEQEQENADKAKEMAAERQQ